MSENSTPTAALEAYSPDGFRVTLSFSAARVDELRQACEKAGRALKAAGWSAAAAPVSTNGNGHAAPPAEQAPLCGFHNTPMEKRQGRNGTFWSCPQKLQNGEWCSYRP